MGDEPPTQYALTIVRVRCLRGFAYQHALTIGDRELFHQQRRAERHRARELLRQQRRAERDRAEQV